MMDRVTAPSDQRAVGNALLRVITPRHLQLKDRVRPVMVKQKLIDLPKIFLVGEKRKLTS